MKKYKIISIVLFLFLTTSLFSQQFDLIPNKSPDEIRVLKILVAADQGYRQQIPDWKEEITNIIDKASKTLDGQIKIQIKIIEFKKWQRKAIKDSTYWGVGIELMETFPRTETTNFDIVIGLTSHHLELPAWCWRAGYILITNKEREVTFDKCDDVKTESYSPLTASERKYRFPFIIIHEIGHIFGCENTDDKTVMDEEVYAMIYSQKDIEIIRKNKWRKFSSTSKI